MTETGDDMAEQPEENLQVEIAAAAKPLLPFRQHVRRSTRRVQGD
jgi:hypothetical protein